MYVDHRFNLLNGTRDRYEIRHTGRLGKYKTKLVNTFFDLVTTGHTWSQVTIIPLLYYCNGTRDLYEIRHTGRLDKYKTNLVNMFFDLVTPGHTWSHLVTKLIFYETFLGWGGVPQELKKAPVGRHFC